MDADPISTLKKPYRPPGFAIRQQHDIENQQQPHPSPLAHVHQRSISTERRVNLRPESFSTPSRAPFHANHDGAVRVNVLDTRESGVPRTVDRPSPYFPSSSNHSNASLGSSSKRPRLSAAAPGVTYRDGETTGYEDNGSDFFTHADPTNTSSVSVGYLASTTASFANGPVPLRLQPLTNLGSNHPRIVDNTGHGSSAKEGSATSFIFSCLWRKPSTRKHQTWENDGMLTVAGGKAVLRNKEDAALIGSGNFPYSAAQAEKLRDEGKIFRIGDKEVELDNLVPNGPPKTSGTFAAPVSRSSTLTSNVHAPPSTTARSFYGGASSSGKLTPKFKPPSRVGPFGKSCIGNPPPKPPAKTTSRSVNEANDDDGNTDFPYQAPITGNKAYQPHAVSGLTSAATDGLGRAPPEPKALFNPDAEGAVVMARPPDDHIERNNKKNLPIVDVVLDPQIAKKLRPHQIEGVKFMYECVMGYRGEGQGCILADDMGLGKTIQSIALILTLLKQTPYYNPRSREKVISRALIACPVTLVQNWSREFQKWVGKDKVGVFVVGSKSNILDFGRNKNFSVIIIGYEKLRNVVKDLKSIQPPIGLIICDEGHRLKSAGAKTTKALREFRAEKRVILSGTPIQNELSEFHSMIDFVNPSMLDSYQCFKKVFEQPIIKSREPGCNRDVREAGQERAETLARITGNCVLRRTSDIIAGYLPPKSEYVVFVAPTPLQAAVYARIIKSRDVQDLLEGNNAATLAVLTVMRKVCNTPGLLLAQETHAIDDEECGAITRGLRKDIGVMFPAGTRWSDPALSGKLLAVQSLLRHLKDETDEKVVLVSNFTSTLNVLEQMCRSNQFNYCRLDGKTTTGIRQSIVDSFNASSQRAQFVFLLSAKSGGTGLNIVGASRLILFDSDWNPSTDLQAMARIHRDGQKKACVIYRFLTTGTLDEKIYQRQIMKTGLAGSLMEPGAGKSKQSSNAFTKEDLHDIFRLHEDTACQTHELLGCDCSMTGVQEPDDAQYADDDDSMDLDGNNRFGNDSDSEDSLPDLSFVKASQYKDPKIKGAKALKNLVALKDWTHIECTKKQEAAIDNIEDGALRETVHYGYQLLKMSSGGQSSGYDGSLSPDEDGIEVISRTTVPVLRGGEVTFVFHKTKSTIANNDGKLT